MRVITREALADWLDAQAAQETLIAPRDVDGVLLYRQVASSDEVEFEYTRPVMSAKDILFPPTERLLTIQKIGGHVALRDALPTGERMLFGVRPCDARGIAALDALFIQSKPVDAHYAIRRESTTIVGLACKQMGDTCFCTSVGGGPNDPTGMDVLLTELDQGFAVQTLTGKGDELARRMTLTERAVELPQPELVDAVTMPPPQAWPAQFEAEHWAQTAERCLSCRACAYVCPTCRCFDVRDEALPTHNGASSFERVRCWDSCAGETYRRIAGGHNSRQAKADRLRNRFECKFYYYPQQVGAAACTGCGRCIDVCPVNIDITEVLAAVAATAAEVSP